MMKRYIRRGIIFSCLMVCLLSLSACTRTLNNPQVGIYSTQIIILNKTVTAEHFELKFEEVAEKGKEENDVLEVSDEYPKPRKYLKVSAKMTVDGADVPLEVKRVDFGYRHFRINIRFGDQETSLRTETRKDKSGVFMSVRSIIDGLLSEEYILTRSEA